ncbi:retinol dehydrogenase 14-like [Bacillus rossius redtenbacheri]|uniref:retinol dehydrogenase 14-like n=1 Tax=Bacillus rossius redtenbacheri TaxID=93214 RepID=UPI002FDD8B15
MYYILFNKWLISAAIALGLAVLYMKLTTGTCKSKRRLDGKTVIVTGANIGIGKETARDLAARGARVIMACRDMSRAKQARDDIVAATGNQEVVTRQLDLSSFCSVRRFVGEVLASESRLDVLINNAGVGGVGRKITKNGLLLGMQTNHYGHFLLTVLLIDLLKKSAPSRIVTVSSILHRYYSFDLDNLNAEKFFGDTRIYSNSKLANILMSNELARRLEAAGVTSNSLHPGAVETAIFRHMPFHLKSATWLVMKLFFKTAVEGAQTSIYLAVSEEVEGVTGKYFADCKEAKPSSVATDAGLAKRLWEKSEEIVQLKPGEAKI